MKILIVDDEPRHLRGMMNLIRQLRPDAEVTAAKDGLAALDQVRQNCPEAILTDIRMPHMDGLAFLGKLKEEGSLAKVIIVSAYNMFEYAQAAIRHGAYDYLLKPVEVENVERLLDRIELQLRNESIQRREKERLNERLTLASSAYRSRLYLSWLNASLTPAEEEEMEKEEWLKGGGILIYSELKGAGAAGGTGAGEGNFSETASYNMHNLEQAHKQGQDLSPGHNPNPNQGLEQSLVQVLEQGWSKLGPTLSIAIPRNGYQNNAIQVVTLVSTVSMVSITASPFPSPVPNSHPFTPAMEKQLRFLADSLSSGLTMAGGGTNRLAMPGRLTHGVSPYCESLFKAGPQAYQAAREANEQNFFSSWEGLFLYNQQHMESLRDPAAPFRNPAAPFRNSSASEDAKSPSPLNPESLIEALLDNGNKNEAPADFAVTQCRAAFDRLSAAGLAKPAILKEQASLLLMKLQSRIHELVDRQVDPKLDSRLTQTAAALIQGCNSYEELMALLEQRLREIHQALKQIQQDKNEIIVANCLRWMEEHMKEDLTLERAADHFFFNASYFSTFMKNKTGRNFSEHITAIRMKRAKELLAQNRLRIYEISAECGYQDTKYFCRVFKKHFGLSPQAYKHTSLPERRNKE